MMTEEENKAIEDYKRVIAMYFKYSDYDLFCSNLMKSGVKGTIQNTMADMVNLVEKLQKENEELKSCVSKDKIREKLDELRSRNDNVCDKIKYKFKEKNKENNISLEMTSQILIAKMDILYELLEDEYNG